MIFFFVSVNYWILSFYLFNVQLDSEVWIKALMCAAHLLSGISYRLTSVIQISGWLWVNRMMSHRTWWVISAEEAVVVFILMSDSVNDGTSHIWILRHVWESLKWIGCNKSHGKNRKTLHHYRRVFVWMRPFFRLMHLFNV